VGKKMERRLLEVEQLEVRETEDEKRKITGYAAVFEKLSEPLFGFREKIAQGAFAEAIEKDDVRALWNHDPNYVLGRNKSGTLRMEENKKGLKIEIDPPETQWANDLLTSIRRGDVDQMSFGFMVEEEEWDRKNKDEPIRTLNKVRLFDVSPVTYPAYPQTSVGVRTTEEVYKDFLAAKDRADEAVEEEQRKKAEAGQEEARRDIDDVDSLIKLKTKGVK